MPTKNTKKTVEKEQKAEFRPTPQQRGRLLVPFSIVAAGLIIAGAIVYVGMANKKVAGTATNAANTTATQEVPKMIPQKLDFNPITDADHIRGDKNAPIKLIEYSDYECPFCKRFTVTLQQLTADYENSIAIVYRNFPIDSLHKRARNEAMAAECVNGLAGNDAYWKFHDLIFANTTSNDGLDPEDLPKFAVTVGVDQKAFASCLAANTYADRIAADEKDAVRAGAQGTPYSIIIGPTGDTIPVSGAQSAAVISKIIDEQLKKK